MKLFVNNKKLTKILSVLMLTAVTIAFLTLTVRVAAGNVMMSLLYRPTADSGQSQLPSVMTCCCAHTDTHPMNILPFTPFIWQRQ